MISAATRRLTLATARYCGIQSLFRIQSTGPTVLFYHGVEQKILDPAVQVLHLPLQVFEKQIAFLRRHREVVSIDCLYDYVVSRKGLGPNHVILTFDDGYKNNLRVVAPLLEAWKLPFTVFVSSNHISEARRFPTYYIRVATHYAEKQVIHLQSLNKSFDLTTPERRFAAETAITAAAKRAPQQQVEQIIEECQAQLSQTKWAELNAAFSSEEPMTWQEVISVSSMGATIGSHCHDHCILHSNQRTEEVNRQVYLGKSTIEANVADCKYMAYPNGTVDDISPSAYSAVKAANFRMAFSTIEGEVSPDVDCLVVPRIFAAPEYEEFCYRLNRSSATNESYNRLCESLKH